MIRELTGSKGRAALGAGAGSIILLVLQQVKAIENESLAITIVVCLTVAAVAYIRYTGLEDQSKEDAKKAEAELESIRLKSMVPQPVDEVDVEVTVDDPRATDPELPKRKRIPENAATLSSAAEAEELAGRLRDAEEKK